MCGIFGFIGADGSPLPPDLPQTMAVGLRHRGPDHTGHHKDSHALLGTCRLAIIDIASGNQPIYNKDASLVIVFNGEIYNHRDLRARLESRDRVFRTRSDTEVILCAFEEYGPDCVAHLDGMFAFAIWNPREQTLFLARDRLGIKPLYTAQPKGDSPLPPNPGRCWEVWATRHVPIGRRSVISFPLDISPLETVPSRGSVNSQPAITAMSPMAS